MRPFVFGVVLHQLSGSAGEDVARVCDHDRLVGPVVDAEVNNRRVHRHERLVANGELQRLTIVEMRLRQAVVEADEKAGPVHPPFGAENARHRVVRGDLVAAALVELKDFDFSVETGGHQQELVAGFRFEVEPCDRLEVLMKDVHREQRFGLAVSTLRYIPQGDASADESRSQNAGGTTFLVPSDLRDLQKVVAVEEDVVLLQLTNHSRFDGQDD